VGGLGQLEVAVVPLAGWMYSRRSKECLDVGLSGRKCEHLLGSAESGVGSLTVNETQS